MNKAKVRPDGGSLMRVVRMFFRYYPVLAPLVVFCILFAAVVSSIPSLFIQSGTCLKEGILNCNLWPLHLPQVHPERKSMRSEEPHV